VNARLQEARQDAVQNTLEGCAPLRTAHLDSNYIETAERSREAASRKTPCATSDSAVIVCKQVGKSLAGMSETALPMTLPFNSGVILSGAPVWKSGRRTVEEPR
jgi:hypothetical protein